MEWVFSGVLIALSAGIAGYTIYLVRRLFRSGADPDAGGAARGER